MLSATVPPVEIMSSTVRHGLPDTSPAMWVKALVERYRAGDEDAEQVAQAIAQAREAELVVHLPDGRTNRKSFKKGWIARLLGK
jgi:uncharacterized circularly permuted ATP-grasp superfamily protein